MKYFRLKNSNSRKEVGFQFQTNGYIEGYEIDGPNSRTKLTYDIFPDFVPDLRFGLHPKSKLTDVVDASNISAMGFLINEKVKNIFSQFKNSGYRFYDATIIDHNGQMLPYFWMHIVSNNYSMIDFEKSIFRKSNFPLKTATTKNGDSIDILNIDDFEEKGEILFHDDYYVVPDEIKIDNKEEYDCLYFSKLRIKSVYISERLAKMLKKEKVTGIEILESSDFQEIV